MEQLRPVADDGHIHLVAVGVEAGAGRRAAGDALAPDRLGLGGQQLGRLEAVALGEQLGAGADEQDVRGGLHDLARDLDRVAVAFDGRDGAGAERAAVHDAGVELDLAEHVGNPAGTDAVIVAVVLDALDRRDGGIHGRAAGAEGGDRGGQADARVGATEHDRHKHVCTIVLGVSCRKELAARGETQSRGGHRHRPVGLRSRALSGFVGPGQLSDSWLSRHVGDPRMR